MYLMFNTQDGTVFNIVKKNASLILALLFLFSPLEQVLAQEINETQETPAQSAEVQASDENTEESLSNMEGNDSLEQSSQASQSSSLTTDSGEVFSTDVTLSFSDPQVNVQSGSLNYLLPIIVPPGRENLHPDLSLKYDSNNRDNTSQYGYGWSLPIPTISRVNKTGINNVYNEHFFTSDFDGELLQLSSTTYQSKVEKGNFRKYQFIDNAWVVSDKFGTVFTFGSSTNEQFVHPSDATKVFMWYLSEVRDANDNFIKFEYYKDNNVLYPETITYTGHGSVDGPATVEFFRESRPDVVNDFSAGFAATTSLRISEIQAKFNTSLVRKYELEYGIGQNENRSLLLSVTETGKDGTNEIVLPPTTFTYESYATSSQNWATSTWNVPEAIVYGTDSEDTGVRFFDVNGDSRPDMVRSRNGSLYNPAFSIDDAVYLHDGDNWVETDEWSIPLPASGVSFVAYDCCGLRIDTGARFVDVNGDGYTDILWALRDSGNGWSKNFGKAYINNKVNGWDEDSNYAIPSDISFAGDTTDAGVEIVDINGDNLPDLVKSNRRTINGGGSYTYTNKTYFNTGNGWEEAGSEWNSPEVIMEQFSDAGTRFVDLNSDGLTDVIRSSADTYGPEYESAYLNTGFGWQQSSQWVPPIPFVNDFPMGARLVDINGDGLVDIYAKSTGINAQSAVYINTGEGWSDETSNWTFPDDMYLLFTWGGSSNLHLVDPGTRFMDVNGDNMIDFVKFGPKNNYPYFDQLESVLFHEGSVPDLLSSVESTQGATFTTVYKQSSQYEDNNGSSTNPHLPSNLDTVAEIEFDSGFASPSSIQYEYAGGDFYYATHTERQLSGFESVTKTTEHGKEITYYHQGNLNNASTSESSDDFAKIGLAYRVEIFDSSDNLYSVTLQNWATTSPGGSSIFARLENSISLQYDGDSDHKDSAISYSYNNQNGNLNSVTEWGEVSASTTGTFTDSGTDKRTTSYTYATNTTPYIIGLPSSEQVTDNSGTKVSETRYYYDTQSLGNVIDGNVTKKESWVSGSNYIDEEWTYNSQGLPLTSKDPRDKTTTYAYDSFNLYPASTTNPLSQVTHYKYDYSSGKVATTTDPNGEVFVTVYDGIDRVLFEKIPDPQTGSTVTQNEYTYTDTAGAVRVQKKSYLTPSITNSTYTYLDGFGRTIQERLEVEDTNTYAVRDFVYGTNGLLQKESLPYFSSGTSRTTASSDNDFYTEYEYDALNRITLASTTVGATETAYDQWAETVTDANGNDKKFTYDAFKRLAQVDEYNGTSTYTTLYTWYARNDLTKITDALGNVRNIAYDGLSRRTSLEDLHDTGDATYGMWTFAYDASSNLASSSDPKGQVIAYTYDDLNRILTENYQGAAGTEVVYEYDSCTEGVGRLCEVANDTATTTFTYTHIGLPAVETKTILGTAYTTEYEYDRLGNKTLIVYPDNSEVKYTYNKANKIEAIEQKESGGSFDYVINDFDYGPHGLITYQLHSNGASTTKKYDENELYRLRNIITTSTTTEGMGGGGQELALAEEELLLMGIVLEDAETNEVQPEATTTQEVSEVQQTAATSSESQIETEPSSNEVEESIPQEESLEIPEVAPEPVSSGNYTDKGNTLELKLNKSDDVVITKNKPEVTFQKWNKEVDLVVSYDKVQSGANVVPNTDKVEWKGEKEEVHAYPLKKSKKLEDGGFEIEVVLSEIPETNVFTFNLKGYENLDFFYQPSLTEEAEDGETCSETSCTNAEGEITKERPEHIVGSYAVYHKEKNNHLEGEENYQAGKVFHILRPQITDAVGNKVWGELLYSNGALTVTVPQDFLHTATYPVVVDPTFGYTSVGGTTLLTESDSFYGSLFTTPADYSSFDSMSAYCYANIAGNDQAKLVIADHNTLNIVSNGVSDPISCNSTAAWKTASFSTMPSLSASTDYVLGFISSTNRINTYYDSGSTDQGHEDYNNSYSSPENPDNIIHSTQKHSVYITYSTGGGGNATPTVPYLLETEGQTNPTNVTDATPEFTAIYKDPDTSDLANFYRIQVATSTAFTNLKWDSTKTALATTTQGTRTGNISYAGSALASSTDYYWRIKFWDDGGLEGAWSTTTASFRLSAATSSNATPTAPILLKTEGQTNPTNVTDATPEFTAVYKDPDVSDSANFYRVQVSTTSSFTSTKWDSTKTSLATTTQGTTTPTISYAGLALASSTTYYWRIKFWDIGGKEGSWSTTTSTFVLASSSEPAFTPFVERIQHLTYTYDAVGNITKIVDRSDTVSAATTTYSYDDLYRLTSASTTQASSSPYVQTFTYDALGNILTKSDQGTYNYTGDTGTNYANPHAVTSIAGVTYKYDRNGNLASTTAGTVHSWDYINRLIESTVGSSNSSYGYDHTNQRVSKIVSTANGQGGGGSNATIFSDSFTETSDTALSNHTPNTGTGWSTIHTYGGATGSSVHVQGSSDTVRGASNLASRGVMYSANSTYSSPDYQVKFKLTMAPTIDEKLNIGLRMDGTAANGYLLEGWWGDNHDPAIYKVSGGSFTQLDIHDSSNGILFGNSDIVRAEVSGSDITMFDENDIGHIYASDSTHTSANKPSLGFGSYRLTSDDLTTTIPVVDDLDVISLSSATGWNSPTTNGETHNNWTNPSNAYSSNNSRATIAADTYVGTGAQDYGDFGFSINSGDEIQGIEVRVESLTDSSGYHDLAIAVSQDNGSTWSSEKTIRYEDEDFADGKKLAGHALSLWGMSWDASDVSNNNFRVKVRLAARESTAVDDLAIDHISVKVFHSDGGGESGTSTTIYPSNLYEETGTTTTKHIYAGDMLVATIEEDTPAPKVYHNHLDHLQSSSIMTDDIGYLTQVLDYYPFGSLRVDDSYGGIDVSKKFTGHELDRETDLTYAGARYLNSDIGKWISQDPAYINLNRLNIQLRDPQSWNSYSYARNNPLILTDPTGEFWWNGFYDMTGYEGTHGAGLKYLEVYGGRDRAMNAINSNQSAIAAASQKYGVDSSLIQAIIYEEQSHLTPVVEPVAESTLYVGDSRLSGSTIGLGQITKGYYGYSGRDLLDPTLNIDAIGQHLSTVRNDLAGAGLDTSPAMIASRYNNGQATQVTSYGSRVNAQISNSSYHSLISGLQSVVKGLQELVRRKKDE